MPLSRAIVAVAAGGSLAVALLTGTGTGGARSRPAPPVVVPRTTAIVGESMPTGEVLDGAADDPLNEPVDGMLMIMSGPAGMGSGQDAMTPGGQNGTRGTRHVPLDSP